MSEDNKAENTTEQLDDFVKNLGETNGYRGKVLAALEPVLKQAIDDAVTLGDIHTLIGILTFQSKALLTATVGSAGAATAFRQCAKLCEEEAGARPLAELVAAVIQAAVARSIAKTESETAAPVPEAENIDKSE